MSEVQIAIIDQEDTQITLAVPGVQGPVGNAIPAGGTTNQVLFKSSATNYDATWGNVTSAMITDLAIVDADVNASAAIAGTKISPNFGSQTIATTGVFSHALGAAATPSISFTGDTNTGIYSPGADQVAVATNGTGRLFVDATGNVGLGTSTFPFATANRTCLDINGASTSLINLKFGNVVGLTLESLGASGSAITAGGTTLPLIFHTNSTERLRITSAGNVGIGTSLPRVNVHIFGTASNAPTLGVASGSLIVGPGDLDYGLAMGTAVTGYSWIQSQNFIGPGGNAYNLLLQPAGGRILVGTSTANANGGILQLTSGITFPATAVAATDVNTLDDYEEGTWTPTVAPQSGSGQSVAVRGEYIKIGKQVTLWGEVAVTTLGTASGWMEITGLPFNAVANDRAVGVTRNRSIIMNPMGSIYSPQNDRLYIVQYDGTTAWIASSFWMFSITYEV